MRALAAAAAVWALCAGTSAAGAQHLYPPDLFVLSSSWASAAGASSGPLQPHVHLELERGRSHNGGPVWRAASSSVQEPDADRLCLFVGADDRWRVGADLDSSGRYRCDAAGVQSPDQCDGWLRFDGSWTSSDLRVVDTPPQADEGLPRVDGAEAGIKLDVGSSASLASLGPIIINVDGTTRRIANWDKMSEEEQRLAAIRIVKRNQQRKEALRRKRRAEESGSQEL
eukprot:TRINITY_DN45426_c0_g1_i1.p1 TRINITY_DN45426_c0_g1~~TRINITY_DN45426_c0_g1_i1.p1  ORF type:complete len:251 (+),score=46.82 TRINITY_DN45426_c0_g1_i1:74-754(+)